MDATIVFLQNWDAIHQKNLDGSNRYRYIINRGSSRSSKTVSLTQIFDLYARSLENKRCTVWRDTKTDCKKTVLNDFLKMLKSENLYKVGQTFNKTESIFTYDTSSTVEIHGTDDEETVHGLTQDMAWLNEPYKISRETFDQIDQRTSDFVIIDYNPKKGHWVEDVIKDKRALVIDSTFKDNPFCPVEQRNKILSYQPVCESKVCLDKILTTEQAKNYDIVGNPLPLSNKDLNELVRCRENEDKNSANIFNWHVYGLGKKSEKPNRIFNWTKMPLEDYLKIDKEILIGVDWGTVDPWGIIEAKYDDGNLYLRELNYLSENQLKEKLTATERLQVTVDTLNDSSGEAGIVTWMFQKLGISTKVPVICDTNRPLKIAALRRKGYNALQANKPKGSIIDGIDLLNNLNVFYTNDSPNIEYEQENYSRKVDRYGVVLEEPEDTDNHLCDPTRYVALYLQIKGLIRKV
jgi:phage terminase large subunit